LFNNGGAVCSYLAICDDTSDEDADVYSGQFCFDCFLLWIDVIKLEIILQSVEIARTSSV